MIDRDDEFGCAMGVILFGAIVYGFSYGCSSKSKEIENEDASQSQEIMTFLASEIMGDYKVIYFDTDNDLSTAEKCDRMDLSDKNFLKIYNLKRGDVVKKSDWTHIVRRAQQEKIRE